MLDAACPGAVFTSPVPDQMLAATKAVNGGAGVLHIVKNYTGDVMNFEMAAELAAGRRHRGRERRHRRRRGREGQPVHGRAARRGRDGAGWRRSAARRPSAATTWRRSPTSAAKVNAQGRSHGHGADLLHRARSAGKPTFDLGEDEMEIGIGIHGEPGRTRDEARHRGRDRRAAGDPILDDLPFKPGDQVLAFVNGMGGTPLIELYVMFNELSRILKGRSITIARNLVGNYITSLEMAGCSITLLRLDDELTKFWDAPVLTPALRWGA